MQNLGFTGVFAPAAPLELGAYRNAIRRGV